MEQEIQKPIEKVKMRGLFRIAAWIFIIWGLIVLIKGFYDSFWGLPESEFVPMKNWTKWAGFEIAYGVICIVVGGLLFELSKRIKEYIEREKKDDSTIF